MLMSHFMHQPIPAKPQIMLDRLFLTVLYTCCLAVILVVVYELTGVQKSCQQSCGS